MAFVIILTIIVVISAVCAVVVVEVFISDFVVRARVCATSWIKWRAELPLLLLLVVVILLLFVACQFTKIFAIVLVV